MSCLLPRRCPSKLLAAVGLLFAGTVLQAQAGGPELFLLAASDGLSATPAVLYRLGPDGKLATVRTLGATQPGQLQVVFAGDSLFVVRQGEGTATVSVVHEAAPLEADELSVPFSGDLSSQQMIAARETTASATELLIPASGGAAGMLAIGTSATSATRIQDARNTKFSVVEYLGRPAAQVPEAGVRVWDEGGALALADHANVVCDAQVPQHLQLSRQRNGPPYTTMVASTKRYALFLAEPDVAVPPRADTTVYVHDRNKKTWGELRVDGSNNSSMRLFGDWLAVRVELTAEMPGTQSSAVRSPDRKQKSTDHLPGYPQSYFPGYVLLHNLETGQDVRLRTGMADTEVEGIAGDAVTYRVGQKLLRGRIEGNNVMHPEELVDDPAVVNIHWIFPAPGGS